MSAYGFFIFLLWTFSSIRTYSLRCSCLFSGLRYLNLKNATCHTQITPQIPTSNLREHTKEFRRATSNIRDLSIYKTPATKLKPQVSERKNATTQAYLDRTSSVSSPHAQPDSHIS